MMTNPQAELFCIYLPFYFSIVFIWKYVGLGYLQGKHCKYLDVLLSIHYQVYANYFTFWNACYIDMYLREKYQCREMKYVDGTKHMLWNVSMSASIRRNVTQYSLAISAFCTAGNFRCWISNHSVQRKIWSLLCHSRVFISIFIFVCNNFEFNSWNEFSL